MILVCKNSLTATKFFAGSWMGHSCVVDVGFLSSWGWKEAGAGEEWQGGVGLAAAGQLSLSKTKSRSIDAAILPIAFLGDPSIPSTSGTHSWRNYAY